MKAIDKVKYKKKIKTLGGSKGYTGTRTLKIFDILRHKGGQ